MTRMSICQPSPQYWRNSHLDWAPPNWMIFWVKIRTTIMVDRWLLNLLNALALKHRRKLYWTVCRCHNRRWIMRTLKKLCWLKLCNRRQIYKKRCTEANSAIQISSWTIWWICHMSCQGNERKSINHWCDSIWSTRFIFFRLNQRILSTDDPSYLDVSGEAHTDLSNINALAQLSVRDMTATLMHSLKYFTSKHSNENLLGSEMSFLTLWVFADLETDNGRQLLRNALSYMVSIAGSFFFWIREIISFRSLSLEIIIRPSRCIHSKYRRC